MRIDVADVCGAELRISKRQTHRLRHLVGLGTGNVRAVGVGAETQNFGINLGAARFGEFKLFENQGAAALADHQTVALGVEGTRRQLRMVVVVSACGKKRIENGGVGSVKLFAAACDHGFGAACENRFVGVSDGLRGRGAGRTRRDDAALDLEEHADVDRCRVRHHAHVDFFDCVYPARNGRHGHAYTNHGKMNLQNKKYELDDRPIEVGCGCPACRHYSRAYIRHLLKAKEMLGLRLLVLHNLYFYNTMMEEIREAIETGTFSEYKKNKLARMEAGLDE